MKTLRHLSLVDVKPQEWFGFDLAGARDAGLSIVSSRVPRLLDARLVRDVA